MRAGRHLSGAPRPKPRQRRHGRTWGDWVESVVSSTSKRGAADGEPASLYLLAGVRATWRRVARAVGQFLYGMTVYEMVRELELERADRAQLFTVLTFGDLVGLPVLSTFYSLRLLPYVASELSRSGHSLLRERDLLDVVDHG